MARDINKKFPYTTSKCYEKEPFLWGTTSIYHPMNNASNFSDAKSAIEHFGAIKFKNFISDNQIDFYRNALIKHTEMDDSDYGPVSRGSYLPAVGINTGGAPLEYNQDLFTI